MIIGNPDANCNHEYTLNGAKPLEDTLKFT